MFFQPFFNHFQPKVNSIILDVFLDLGSGQKLGLVVLAFSFWGPVKSWVWGFELLAFGVLEAAGFRGFGFQLLGSCQTPGLGGLAFSFWDPGGSWVLGFQVSGFGILEEAGSGGSGFQLLSSWRKLVLRGLALRF